MTARTSSPTRLTREDVALVASWRRELSASTRSRMERWTAAYRDARCFVDSPPLHLDSVLVDGGGFLLTAAELEDLTDEARAWWRTHAGRTSDGWCTRGYAYYAADAGMWIPPAPPAAARWDAVRTRLRQHPRLIRHHAGLLQDGRTSWAAWLSVLGHLEWVLNDLTTALWLLEQPGGSSQLGLDGLLADASGVFADLAWHLPRSAADDLAAASASLEKLATGLEGTCWPEGGTVADSEPDNLRAVREGDEPWRVAALVETHLLPLLDAHPGARVALVAEAFGALGMAHLARAFLPHREHHRVLTRVTRNSVHEAEMNRRVGVGLPVSGLADDMVVVHVDDGIFTGATHEAFRASLGPQRVVHLACTSIDVATPHNHPEELERDGTSTSDRLAWVDGVARSVHGSLPPAPSHWVRRRRSARPADEFRRVTEGSDRLFALLWRRYEKEIVGA